MDDITVTVTTGDFFVFHPLELMNGVYYTDSDINLDCMVIDDLTAWQLFGAMDVDGMTVKMGEKIYTISGVVKSPQETSDKLAYGDKPHIYVPYMSVPSGAALTVYEMCIPEAVDGYAANIAKENVQNAVIIDQTDRFDVIKLIQGFKDLDDSVMVRTGFAYPWFENALRAAELKARVLALPMAVLMVVPAITLVYLMFVMAKLIARFVLFIRDRLEDRRQKRLKKAYAKTHPPAPPAADV